MRSIRIGLIAATLLALATVSQAGVKTREIQYAVGDSTFQGYVAWNDSVQGRRPGILVVHEWWGHNAHARHQAERLAEAGYVGFALDMFGKGKLAEHPADAQAFVAEATKDPAVAKARFDAARAILEKDPHVDPKRIGAIGYCFGGGVALDMARAGEDLEAVATFHGVLATEHPAEKGKVKAPLLVMAGAEDPFVPDSQVVAFEREMKNAGAKFKVIRYPGARHSFTNPDAGTHGMEALQYNAEADRKSWAELLKFLKATMK
jgi:dienelactone hydrolase